MSAIHLAWNPVDQQLDSLRALVEELRRDVGELRAENAELRRENAELRQQVNSLKCDVGYWKSRHADAVRRNTKLQAGLDQAKAEIRQLKAEQFGKKSEKQSASDRTNRLDDPKEQTAPKKKRGRQPGSPAPKRRDYSHLPARIQEVDVPDDAKVCACCGCSLAKTRSSMCSTRHAATMCRNHTSAKRSRECWSLIATVRTRRCGKSSWANWCSRSAGLMCGVTLCGSARAIPN